jgi:single-stranded DNA-binding protein
MNRQWTDSEKQVHEETDWIYIVLWNKENLAADTDLARRGIGQPACFLSVAPV